MELWGLDELNDKRKLRLLAELLYLDYFEYLGKVKKDLYTRLYLVYQLSECIENRKVHTDKVS